MREDETCKHCGGLIVIRNPTGKCDHLYWPDMLTDEAKIENSFQLVTKKVWEKVSQFDNSTDIKDVERLDV